MAALVVCGFSVAITTDGDVHKQLAEFAPRNTNTSEHVYIDSSPAWSVLESKVITRFLPSLENTAEIKTGGGGATLAARTVSLYT